MNQTIKYDFVAPGKIALGWGRRSEVGTLARSLGRRAFLVSGLPDSVAGNPLDEIVAALRAEDVEATVIETIDHEPEVKDVDRVAATVRGVGPGPGDFMLGVGGGAAIDLAKAVAAMATNAESPTVKDYLENVGRNLRLVNGPLPVLAMPTTAGTGAEATRNAVISSYDPPFKKSLRDERLIPRIALVDPELTVTLPPEGAAKTTWPEAPLAAGSFAFSRSIACWEPVPGILNSSEKGFERELAATPRTTSSVSQMARTRRR